MTYQAPETRAPLNFSLTDEQHRRIQAYSAKHLAEYWKEEIAESFSLDVRFSFTPLGRQVICEVPGMEPLVICSDLAGEPSNL